MKNEIGNFRREKKKHKQVRTQLDQDKFLSCRALMSFSHSVFFGTSIWIHLEPLFLLIPHDILKVKVQSNSAITNFKGPSEVIRYTRDFVITEFDCM